MYTKKGQRRRVSHVHQLYIRWVMTHPRERVIRSSRRWRPGRGDLPTSTLTVCWNVAFWGLWRPGGALKQAIQQSEGRKWELCAERERQINGRWGGWVPVRMEKLLKWRNSGRVWMCCRWHHLLKATSESHKHFLDHQEQNTSWTCVASWGHTGAADADLNDFVVFTLRLLTSLGKSRSSVANVLMC